MSDEELEEYRNRPWVTMEEAAADKAAYAAFKRDPTPENLKRLVAARELSLEEIRIEEQRRRSSKNTLGDSRASSVSDQRRDQGIDAFIYTPPAKVTKAEVEARAVNLVQYKTEPLREQWVQLPWYKALAHWFRGNRIRVDSKE